MIGDNIQLKPHHMTPAKSIVEYLQSIIKEKWVIAIGGESGCGKSTLSMAIQKSLEEKGYSVMTLHFDDYFILPPHTNHLNREKDLANVGIHEVDMGKLQSHIDAFNSGLDAITKPLVDFHNNSISEETLIIGDKDILIVEGTYTLALNTDTKIFMTRNYIDTKEARIARGRDQLTSFVEEVLDIEHKIIKEFKKDADIIVNKDYSIEFVKE